MKKYFIIFSILILSIFAAQKTFAAGTAGYQPLTPIPGLTSDITTGGTNGESSPGFAGYLRALYIWGVAAASGLAVIMIMWGGVEYMTSAGGSGVEEAKKRISSAITGLLLALGSYIILYTINRDLLNLNFTIGDLDVTVNGNAAVKIVPQTSTQDSSYTSSGGSFAPVAQPTQGGVQTNSNSNKNGSSNGSSNPTLPTSADSNTPPNPPLPNTDGSPSQTPTALPSMINYNGPSTKVDYSGNGTSADYSGGQTLP